MTARAAQTAIAQATLLFPLGNVVYCCKSTEPILQTHSVLLVSWMEGTARVYKAVLHNSLFSSHSHICCLIWAREKSGFERASEGTAMPKNLILQCGISRAGSITYSSKYPNIKSSTIKKDYILLFFKHFKLGAAESLRAMKKGRSYSFGVWNDCFIIWVSHIMLKTCSFFLVVTRYSIQAQSFHWSFVFTDSHLNHYQTNCFTNVQYSVVCQVA